MRRMAWFMVVAVALVLLPGGRLAAMQATTPEPDFNGDGFGDLAVGFPGEDLGRVVDAGGVSVLYGSTGGLSSDGRTLSQDTAGVPGTAEASDRFGTALLAGRFNTDQFWDLAVGAPGEDVGAVADAGALAVLYGLDGVGTQLLTQQDAAGTVEAGDRFGAALSDPFHHESDVLADLGVGAPGETVGGRSAAGAGSVLFGAVSGGLGAGGSQFFYQGVNGLGGAAEAADAFAAALS